MGTETFEDLAFSTELRKAVQRAGVDIMLSQARAKVEAPGIERHAHGVERLLTENWRNRP